MFWSIPSFSGPSSVDAILDKESFTLEELLDEEDIIQECKALNNRLINFLRERDQVEELLQYIVEEAPEDAESKRAFRFPFVACEIFACEIDVILKTLVEDEELLNILFSFLQPNRSHSSFLAAHFSKVVLHLMVRKTAYLMNYVQNHKDVLQQLVDLIGIRPIMEILIRLVGGDDHIYPNFLDIMQWLADSDFLEMIVDKLSSFDSSEVLANATEVLAAIVRNGPSALASKLASPSYVARIFDHGLEDASFKSALVHSLSLLICVLDPKRTTSPAVLYPIKSQHLYEPAFPIDPEIVGAMLQRLADLVKLLDVSFNGNILSTTYGELRSPLGKHRLKIVEFMAVLLGTGGNVVANELVSYGAIRRIVDLFFEYPFNNALHHHVERIIILCLESKHLGAVEHLFRDLDILGRFLQAESNPNILSGSNKTTLPAAGRKGPRVGYIGHITRISNKLVQLGSKDEFILAFLQENAEWADWQANILHERNTVENVYHWVCGRPTELQERPRDSDEEELQERDYDAGALASNLSQAFRYYQNDDAEQVAHFDDESAEAVISSLRLGEDSESSLFTNSNWFAFRDNTADEDPSTSSTYGRMKTVNIDGAPSSHQINEEGEVIGESGTSLDVYGSNESTAGLPTDTDMFTNQFSSDMGKASSPDHLQLFQFESRDDSEDLFDDEQLPEWVAWGEPSGSMISEPSAVPSAASEASDPAKSGMEEAEKQTASLFEEDAEFVGGELDSMGRVLCQGTEGHLKWDIKKQREDGSGMIEFNDKNSWRVEPEVGMVQE